MSIALLTKLGVIGLVFISTGLIVGIAWERLRRRSLSQRLRRLDDLPVRPLDQSQSGDWIESVVRSTGALSKLSGSEDVGALSDIRQKLIRAGWRNRSAPMAFFGFKTLMVMSLPVILSAACLVISDGADLSTLLLTASIGGAIGYYLPDLVVNGAVSSRQSRLLEQFPDALDLLNVCLEAGLSLESALVRVANEMAVSHALLAEELNLVVLEMRAGRPRDEALRNLARRNGLSAIESFVATLTQAERFGGSIGDAIRVYSDTLRTQRRQGAEEQAAKIGTKLTVPLVVCILPVLFMVMAGPAMLAVYEAFSGPLGGK